MKNIYKLFTLLILLIIYFNSSAQKLSGTFYIPSGKYKSLTCDSIDEDGSPGIFAAINSDTLVGDITIIIDGDLTNESGTITLNQWIEAGGSGYKVKITPDGTIERLISVSSYNDLLTFNGVSRVTIDGQFNNDSLNHLRFRNHTGYNSDVTFINGASKNTIQFCNFETNIVYTYSAAILFSTSGAETGNSNNTISYCNISDISGDANIPYFGIYSSGSSSPQDNNNNTISNCNIYNFSYAGISISNSGNGDNWIIKDNSIYYNLSTPDSSGQIGIDFEPGVASNNNIITGNNIGGSAPDCGGIAWNNSGDITFYGIYVNAGTTTSTIIQNNKIQNLSLSGVSSSFYGIDAEAGTLVSIKDNTIGNPEIPNSITSGQGNMYGIYNALAKNVDGQYIIENNIIANIFSTSGNNLIGIANAAGSPAASVNIKSNNIYNISGSTSGIFNIFRGIDVGDSCVYNINGNSIHDLSTASVNGWNWGWGLTGIVLSSSSPGQTITQNYIYNIFNTDTAADGLNVYGIVYSGPKVSSPVSAINSNRIYNLTAATSVSSGIYGILIVSDNMGYGSFPGGCSDVVNNMISLGSEMNRYSQTIYGIFKSGIYDNNFYFNSVYIGGSSDNGGATTACYYNYASTNDVLKNNIFYNASNNSGNSIAVHFAIITSGTENITLDYNDYIVTGLGGILSDVSDTIPLLTGQDANSIKSAPEFVLATDLHLTSASINSKVEGKGLDLSENNPPYIVDIDNDSRTSHPDLGADQYKACIAPVVFNVTGGGSFCAGASGVDIGLSGSQTGATYELLSKDNPVGNNVNGTGSPVSFGLIAAEGIYTVRIMDGGTYCTSLMNGNATIIITPLPSAPLADNASGIQKNQFIANWESVTGATQYYFDLAFDIDFTNFVAGYNNKPADNLLSFSITGLSPNTVYYFRVRADNTCVSDNSNIIKVTTASEEGISSLQANQLSCNIYITYNNLFINYDNPMADKAILKIFNLTGQQVVNDINIRKGNYWFVLDLNPDCYIAEIISSKQLFIKKININKSN